MTISNPEKVIKVKNLDYFKSRINQNADDKFATKQELSELKGPTYNPQTRTITYPTTSAVTYDAANRKIVIPTAGV